MCPLFFRFPSHLCHHRALSRVPFAIQYMLLCYTLVIYFIHNSGYMSVPISQFILPSFCLSISALQISSSVSFILHSTYKWFNTICVFVFVTIIFTRSVYVAANGTISSFYGWVMVHCLGDCVCVCVCIISHLLKLVICWWVLVLFECLDIQVSVWVPFSIL